MKIMGYVTVKQYLEGKENVLPRTCNPTNMVLLYLGQGAE
jgi:hypothetical protein